VQDQSNFDNKYNRNRIRNLILPEVLNVNPGIHKVIRKKINNESVVNLGN
jgi:tRNA(Ile)-lysidine synthase TilS/MesJ